MEWNGKTIVSSMKKTSVAGPIVVHRDSIDGNTFAQPQFHGAPHSVLYAFGMKSALEFAKTLGRDSYEAGTTGETVTLDDLDETDVSVGDIYRFGSVLAQATYPRIPCGKVNFRMQHERGQKAMQDCGRSGVYFKILEPGKIALSDKVERVERAREMIPISEVYRYVVKNEKPPQDFIDKCVRSGCFPKRQIEKWTS